MFFERILKSLFLLLIFSLPFVQPFSISISNSFGQPSDLIFLIVFTLFFSGVLLKKIKFKFHFFYFLLAFYLAAMILSAIFSIDSLLSFFKLLGEIYLMVLCMLTFNLVRTEKMFRMVCYAWIAAMSIVGVIGVLTVILFYLSTPENFLLRFSLHHYGTLIPGNYPRIQTTFFYPSMLCHYLTIGLMLLLVARKNHWIEKNLFFIISGLTILTLIFTLTPGLGGVALCLGLWFRLEFKEKAKFAQARFCLLGAVLLAVFFLFVSLVSPVQTPTSPFFLTIPVIEKRLDPSVRVLTWKSAIQTFAANPLVGKGIGTDAADVVYKDASNRIQHLKDAHQIWLNVAAQEGIFGLLAILAISIYLWRNAFPLKFDGKRTNVLRSGLSIAILSAFFYQGLVGSFEDARHLWILIGLILVNENKFDELNAGNCLAHRPQ